MPSEYSIYVYPPSLRTERKRGIGDYQIDYKLLSLVKEKKNFGHKYKNVYLNRWLEDLGLPEFKKWLR